MMRPRVAALAGCIALFATSCSAFGLAADCEGIEIIGKFAQVGDLVEKSNVQSSDVVIGSVTDIELDQGNWEARVSMCLDEGERVPEDVRAIVRTTSLLGEKFVDLRIESEGAGPYLEDGAVLEQDQTGKSTELEEVFARLATILGSGNLESLNRFTTAQARILEGRADDLRLVLGRLRDFTDLLADRKDSIAAGVDNLDAVARRLLEDSPLLRRFLRSFADSSTVLSNQKDALQELLFVLDDFTAISIQLLNQTEAGLDEQLEKLRPVLRTAVANSQNLTKGIQTLATFTDWFPESMPGDYLQLDVCQALPEDFQQGVTCPQSVKNDKPKFATSETEGEPPSSALESILRAPLRDED